MKKIIFVLTLSVFFFANSYANNSEIKKKDDQSTTIVTKSIISDLTIPASLDLKIESVLYDNMEDCTVSAEVDYNGTTVKLSVTGKDCIEAGKKLAQAVKGFTAEIAEN
ncbi:hypothetical protein GWK08_05845 [Leptobacterium flavescens]|uniref:Uncharacterized protein n=1 Tax=Leptobacterium flavescens TaxID=472055 RepID=A0A6P0UK76_9FLAO|nr:hypothetical protein [Leptobacterium flavescens]NER12952.1 hypothetical protein [Leptobacterium flavescens]